MRAPTAVLLLSDQVLYPPLVALLALLGSLHLGQSTREQRHLITRPVHAHAGAKLVLSRQSHEPWEYWTPVDAEK